MDLKRSTIRYSGIQTVPLTIVTMFDIEVPEEFATVAKALSSSLKNSKISEVFFETFSELNSLPYESCNKNNTKFKLGIDKNVKRYTKEEAEKYGVVKPDEIKSFKHLHLYLPTQFVDMGNKSIEAIMADYRDAKSVFQRAMIEISLDTKEEVKEQFLDHVRMLVNYYEKETTKKTLREKLEGLAFSILVTIDGEDASLPSFILAPMPHEDDKQYRIDNGENYYPENHDSDVKCDISGGLHDSFFKE